MGNANISKQKSSAESNKARIELNEKETRQKLLTISKWLEMDKDKLQKLLDHKLAPPENNNDSIQQDLNALRDGNARIEGDMEPDHEMIVSWIQLLRSTNPLSLCMVSAVMGYSKINVEAFIYRHHQNINALHSTLNTLDFIGFTVNSNRIQLNPQWNYKRFVFYSDLFCNRMFAANHSKRIHGEDWKGMKTRKYRIRFGMDSVDDFEWEFWEKNLNHDDDDDDGISLKQKKRISDNQCILEHDVGHEQQSLNLMTGYLRKYGITKTMVVPLDVIRLLLTFYLIPNLDTNYKWIWCNVKYDGQRMNLYDVANDREYTLNVTEHKLLDIQLNIRCIMPFAVKNVSFPQWISDAVNDNDDEYGGNMIFDDIRNEDHLSILFQPKIIMILDSRSGIGHRITFKQNDQKHRIYGFNPLNGCILNHNVFEGKGIEEYDISTNQMVNEYAVRNRTDSEMEKRRHSRFWKASSCIFDGNSKLFVSDSEYHCNIVRLRGTESVDEEEEEGVIKVPSMSMKRANHTLLYHKENAQIIVGGGAYSLVEMFDLEKNRWDFIDCTLNHRDYEYKPYLWYDNYEPFILNIATSFVFRRGGGPAEFIDLREQRQWYPNDKINRYLAQSRDSPLVMF